jgi:phosphoesterase RecJ-like protein
MSQKGRPQRVAELIREEIAKLLVRGLKDPRIGFVSVMAVRMSPDLRYANVYVSLYGDDKERRSSLAALSNSAGWVRHEVGKYLRMRYLPQIRFLADTTLDEVYHLEEVLQEIHADQDEAPMMHVGLEAIAEELRAAKSVLITTHENPDGDAIGSMLGLRQWLLASGVESVACAMADPAPRIYRNLPGVKKILTPHDQVPEFDVVAIVDVAKLDRIGVIAKWIEAGKKIIVLDHHLETEPGGTLGFLDPSYAAAGEIIFDLFKVTGTALTAEAAHCLYVAQVTDTCGYRFSNTNPRSHRIAAELLEAGLDVEAIASQVFDSMSLAKFGLLRRVLDRTELDAAGQLAYSFVTSEDLESVGGKKEDLDGLINFVRNIEGVKVAALINGIGPALTKVSLRARRGFNGAGFLSRFGGGGHAGAAGATIEKPYLEVMSEVLKELRAALTVSEQGDQE